MPTNAPQKSPLQEGVKKGSKPHSPLTKPSPPPPPPPKKKG
jgi:hypothetical protein